MPINSVGGLLLPFRFVSGPAGQPGVAMVRSRMEINPRLPATLFMKGR